MLIQAIGRSARNEDTGSVTWANEVMSYTTHRIQSQPIEGEIKGIKLYNDFYEGYYGKTKMNPSLGSHPGMVSYLNPIKDGEVKLGQKKYKVSGLISD